MFPATPILYHTILKSQGGPSGDAHTSRPRADSVWSAYARFLISNPHTNI